MYPLPLSDMKCKNNDDRARKWEDAISLKYYIAHLLATLGCARIWPTESFSPCQMLLSKGATIVLIVTGFLTLLSEITALTMNNNLELFANIIGVICMHATSFIKWCYCIRRNREIVDIIMKLEKCNVLCQRIDESEEGCRMYRNEMECARRHSNFFIWWWMSACIYGVLHWCVNPLLLESWTPDQINSINRTLINRNLPFIGWYPLNIDDIHNYIYLYLMQIICGLFSAIGIVCYDAFYVTMLIIICALLQHINTILTKIDFDNVPEATFVLEKKLKNCVDCHMEILKFLKTLQIFSGPIMFVQCIETLVLLCLVSFEASAIKIALDKESILKLWSLLEYILCSSFQLYFFCFIATRIEHLGSEIAHSVYCCGWELIAFRKKEQSNFGTQSKHCNIDRLVQTIMIRAQKPIILTGGPFYVLSLETFRLITSMAISNSVMLRTISDADA